MLRPSNARSAAYVTHPTAPLAPAAAGKSSDDLERVLVSAKFVPRPLPKPQAGRARTEPPRRKAHPRWSIYRFSEARSSGASRQSRAREACQHLQTRTAGLQPLRQLRKWLARKHQIRHVGQRCSVRGSLDAAEQHAVEGTRPTGPEIGPPASPCARCADSDEGMFDNTTMDRTTTAMSENRDLVMWAPRLKIHSGHRVQLAPRPCSCDLCRRAQALRAEKGRSSPEPAQ